MNTKKPYPPVRCFEGISRTTKKQVLDGIGPTAALRTSNEFQDFPRARGRDLLDSRG